MKFKNFSKKFILAIVLFSIIFTVSGLIFTKPARGAACCSVVIDPTHIAKTILQTVKDELMEELRNYRLYLRDVIVRQVVRRVSDQVVEWVQGDGVPQFVGDWAGYSNQAYARGANEAWEEIPADYICPQFRDDLQRTLGVRFSDNPRQSQSGWIESLKCTLGENDYSFAAPQNNLYGAATLIRNQTAYQGATRVQAAQNEAIAGQGYISPKKCLESNDAGQCLKEIITTPGNLVGDIVSKALGSDIDYITNIQSWMGALINGVITRLLQNTGLSGMSTTGTEVYDYGGTGTDESLEHQKQTIIRSYQKMLAEEQTVLNTKRESLKTAKEILNRCYSSSNIQQKITTLNQEIAELESIINRINLLIAGVEALTRENYSSQISSVQNDYREFMTSYGEQILQNAGTGEARNAAQQELQELQRNLQWCNVI